MSSKKSLITAISIHKETDNILNKLQEKFHKTRSELIREMIMFYSQSQSKPLEPKIIESQTNNPSEIIKSFVELINQKNLSWPQTILTFAIITRGEQILIGLKSKNDSLIKNISWCFPYLVSTSLNIESEAITTLYKDLGFKISADLLLDAQFVPDRTLKKIPVLAIYLVFKTKHISLPKNIKYPKLKWIRKSDYFEYSTTSLPQKVVTFLNS